MTWTSILQAFVTAGLAALFTLLVQLMLSGKKDISEQKTAIRKRRSENHLRRHDHLAKLITSLKVGLQVAKECYYHNARSGDDRAGVWESALDGIEECKIKFRTVVQDAIIQSELYGNIPMESGLATLNLSDYVSAVLQYKLQPTIRYEESAKEQQDAYSQGHALMLDIRRLMAQELLMAEQVMIEEQYRKKNAPVELPYLQTIQPHFNKTPAVVEELDMKFLERVKR